MNAVAWILLINYIKNISRDTCNGAIFQKWNLVGYTCRFICLGYNCVNIWYTDRCDTAYLYRIVIISRGRIRTCISLHHKMQLSEPRYINLKVYSAIFQYWKIAPLQKITWNINAVAWILLINYIKKYFSKPSQCCHFSILKYGWVYL